MCLPWKAPGFAGLEMLKGREADRTSLAPIVVVPVAEGLKSSHRKMFVCNWFRRCSSGRSGVFIINTENMVYRRRWVRLKDCEAANALPPPRIRSAPTSHVRCKSPGLSLFVRR
jgi:hypothetical protein